MNPAAMDNPDGIAVALVIGSIPAIWLFLLAWGLV